MHGGGCPVMVVIVLGGRQPVAWGSTVRWCPSPSTQTLKLRTGEHGSKSLWGISEAVRAGSSALLTTLAAHKSPGNPNLKPY